MAQIQELPTIDEEIVVPLRKLKRLIRRDEPEIEEPKEENLQQIIIEEKPKAKKFSDKLKKMTESNENQNENIQTVDNVEETQKLQKPRKKAIKKEKNKEINDENLIEGVKIDKTQEEKGKQKTQKKEKKPFEFKEKKFISVFSDSDKEIQKGDSEQEKIEVNEEIVEYEKPMKKLVKLKKKEKENSEIISNIDEDNENTVPTKRNKLKKIRKLDQTDESNFANNSTIKNKKKKEKSLENTSEQNDLNENLEVANSPIKKLKKNRITKKVLFDSDGNEIKENEQNKKKKEKPIKKPEESTQSIFERLKLDPTFAMEEEDSDHNDSERNHNHHENNNDDRLFGVKKDRNRKDHHIIKTRNKFFREINTLENIQTEENNNYEEDLLIESKDIIIEPKLNKPKPSIESFLSKLQIYRDEKILTNPQNTSNLDHQLNIENKEPVVPRQGDLFNIDQTNNIEQEKTKPQTLKASSHELSKFLNNTLSNFSIEENSNLNLQISIPTQGKSINVTETTLFVNKLARSNSMLNKSILNAGGLEKKISSNSLNGREMYRNQLIEEVRKRKSKHINMSDLHERFRQTDLSEITAEKKKRIELAKTEEENQILETEKIKEEQEMISQQQYLDYKRMVELEEGKSIEQQNEASNEIKNEEIDENLTENNEDHSDQDQKEENQTKNKGFSSANQITSELNEKEINLKDIKEPNKEIENKKPEDLSEEENTLEETRVFKKLRKLAGSFSQKYNIDQVKVEKKLSRSINDPRLKQMLQKMFEIEAELGSDNEENDDLIKKIDNKDADEKDSDGEMDEELREMIDNNTEIKEEDEEKLLEKFYQDLIKQDKDDLKKVMQRAFAVGNKRKNFDFEIDEEDREKKKMEMIQERIKLLEDREHMFGFDMESNDNQKNQTNNDFLLEEKEEENIIKIREINNKIRKEVEKKMPKIDESQIIDANIFNLLNKEKENDSINFLQKSNIIKPEESKRFVNSVLQVKLNKNNISIFNNSYNKDIVNEYGSKLNMIENLKKNVECNEISDKIQTKKPDAHKMSSLNKFFSSRNKEFNRPSPNKVFVFGFKK